MQGGYLLGAALTVKYVFDVHPGDKYACMADVGWITGHTYIIYGPLLNGVTTTIFESTPVYPTPSRYWDVVDQHKLTHLYTAPTAIRLLRRLGEEHVRSHDLSSLRVIGSVGEPINPEAWHWYQKEVGRGECAVVDTYWQTETGSIVVTPLPGAVPTKPGSATFPFWGIEPVILECVLSSRCASSLISNATTDILPRWPAPLQPDDRRRPRGQRRRGRPLHRPALAIDRPDRLQGPRPVPRDVHEALPGHLLHR